MKQSVSIAYTFLSVDYDEILVQTARIERILNEVLSGRYTRVSTAKTHTETEVIYSIEAPLFDGELQKGHFFRALKAVLDDTADLKPYFSEYKGGDIR